jgi:hypothetical protein
VAEQHVVNVLGLQAVRGEARHELAGLHGVDVLALGGMFAARACVRQDVLAASANEGTVQVDGHPVALVRGHVALPQHAGHDAEQRAAIQPHGAIAQQIDLQITGLHTCSWLLLAL